MVRILLRLWAPVTDQFLQDLLRCFDDISDYRPHGTNVSFEVEGNTSTREWLDATTYEVTRGLGLIQRMTVEYIDAYSKSDGEEDATGPVGE